MKNTNDVTDLVVSRLVKVLDENKINIWIKPLKIEKEDNNYIIKVTDYFMLDIIKTRYIDFIQAALEVEFNKVDSIKLEVIKNNTVYSNPEKIKIIAKIKSNK